MALARQMMKLCTDWAIHIALIVSAFMMLVHGTPSGQTADNLLFDRFVDMESKLTNSPSRVLLVYAEPSLDRDPERYLRLLRRLKNLLGVFVAAVLYFALAFHGRLSRSR